MALQLERAALDVGFVTDDGPAMLGFYRDVLGFESIGDREFPGIGLVHRLRAGQSVLRILVPERPAVPAAAEGDFLGARGIRYMMVACTNLDEVVAECRAAGRPVPVEPLELRPGVRVAQVLDPDRNLVELIQGE